MTLNFLNKLSAKKTLLSLKKENIIASFKRVGIMFGSTLFIGLITHFLKDGFLLPILVISTLCFTVFFIILFIMSMIQLVNPFFIENKSLANLFVNNYKFFLEEICTMQEDFNYTQYEKIEEIIDFLISFQFQSKTPSLEEIEEFKKLKAVIEFNKIATQEKYIPSQVKEEIEKNHYFIYKKMMNLIKNTLSQQHLIDKMSDDFDVKEALFEASKYIKTKEEFIQKVQEKMNPLIKEEIVKHTKSLAL